jgi:hypothetical protein
METELITFRTFDDLPLAEALAAQLGQHCIENVVIKEDMLFNGSSLFNTAISQRFSVKISPDKFELANEMLTADETTNINEIDQDYYLFSFDNRELLDVIAKADEWSAFDYALALKILADRGEKLSDEEVESIKTKRIEKLKEPEKSQAAWIAAGYIFAVAGGILGIFIGWHLATYKKTLPNGERVFGYSDNDRTDGRRIMYIGMVIFAIGLLWRMLPILQS